LKNLRVGAKVRRVKVRRVRRVRARVRRVRFDELLVKT